MYMRKLLKLRPFYSILFFLFTFFSAVIGSRSLISVAFWLETEIYIAATVAFIVGGASWFFLYRNIIVRLSLLFASILSLSFFSIWQYRDYQTLNPSIYDYIHYENLTNGKPLHFSKQNKILQNILRNTQGNREHLLKLLNNQVEDSQLISKADSLLNHYYQYYEYTAVRLPKNLTWQEYPFDDKSWNFRLHTMDYVVTLSRAYEETKNVTYLKHAEHLIIDWIDDNTLYAFQPPSEFSWGDHSTAFRLLNWLYFIDVWKDSEFVTAESLEKIMRATLGHVLILLKDDFYNHNHNHGIDQDRAVIAFTLMHPYIGEPEKWRDTALHRFLKQVEFAVSPSGIHLEHSSGYHFYGLQQIKKTLTFLDNWSVDHQVIQLMKETIPRMMEFIPNIVKPDGYLIQLGDTGVTPITRYRNLLSDIADLPPIVKQLIETGSTQYLSDEAVAFKEEGYALIRDFSWGSRTFQDSFYLFFSAGAHEGRTHRQADDLSFVLSYAGSEILVDPGVYSYKNDTGRDYVVSAAAHNTVTIDGASYHGWDTSLDAFTIDERYTLIRGSHRNYPGFQHTRWISYLLKKFVVIIDRLHPTGEDHTAGEKKFEQLLHFSPRVAIELNDVQNSAYSTVGAPDLQTTMVVTQLGEIRPSMQIVKGENSPMQGWHSIGHAQLVPAPTLISQIEGKEAEFITLIDLNGERNTLDNLQEEAGKFSAVSSKGNIVVSVTNGLRRQTFNFDLINNRISIE